VRDGDKLMGPKSTAEKLLIRPDSTVWSSHGERLELVEPLPHGVRVVSAPDEATTALVFGDDAEALREIVATYGGLLAQPENLWIAYPKGNRTDMNRDTLWPIVAPCGVRPIGQVSVDEVWSAMRFRALKPGEQPFQGGDAA
jgi:hypothetical protein